MSYVEKIKAGMSFLLQCQNTDGGISIGNSSDGKSGVWTTAECLDAILSSHYFELDVSALLVMFNMVQYLIDRFILSFKGDMGYWPIDQNNVPSTLTTGHAIHSLYNFKNKILDVYDFDSITIGGKSFSTSEIKNAIEVNIKKAIKWLFVNKQIDNGWSDTEKRGNKGKSSILCVYYVLKGYNAIGKTCENDKTVENACYYVKEAVKSIINNKKSGEAGSDLPNVLYGYSCLVSSGYFSKTDESLRKKIVDYINSRWKETYKTRKMPGLTGMTKSFIFNMPYIALDTLLIAEEYSLKNKINKLAKELIKKQAIDGSWSIQREDNKETTWVTAESIIVLGKVEQRFIQYQQKVLLPKKLSTLICVAVILSVITSSILIYYFAKSVIPGNDVIHSLPGAIIGLLSLISSIISIVGLFRK